MANFIFTMINNSIESELALPIVLTIFPSQNGQDNCTIFCKIPISISSIITDCIKSIATGVKFNSDLTEAIIFVFKIEQ